MKTDREIQKDVILELQFDPAINSEKIGVSVEDGIVTLSGYSSRYADKYAAEKRALSVYGVKGVVEGIKVECAQNYSKSDHVLAKAAYEALFWNVLVPDSVHIAISSGIATLSGTVKWAFESKAAMDTIRHLTGIIDVKNEIVIEPAVTASDVKDRIEKALIRAAGDDAKNIQVEVEDRRVKLSGKVSSEKEIKDAKWAAWSAPGVRDVDNQLLICR